MTCQFSIKPGGRAIASWNSVSPQLGSYHLEPYSIFMVYHHSSLFHSFFSGDLCVFFEKSTQLHTQKKEKKQHVPVSDPYYIWYAL